MLNLEPHSINRGSAQRYASRPNASKEGDEVLRFPMGYERYFRGVALASESQRSLRLKGLAYR
jgi:hypothetical protein